MLRSIATARSRYTTKYENKSSYSTDCIVLNLIDFLAMIEKRSEHKLKREIFIFVKYIVLTKNWFLVSIFWEFLFILVEVFVS